MRPSRTGRARGCHRTDDRVTGAVHVEDREEMPACGAVVLALVEGAGDGGDRGDLGYVQHAGADEDAGAVPEPDSIGRLHPAQGFSDRRRSHAELPGQLAHCRQGITGCQPPFGDQLGHAGRETLGEAGRGPARSSPFAAITMAPIQID
jgi:hypothetical protein